MSKQMFEPADKIKVLTALTGKKAGERPAAYFERITTATHDDSDHEFESSVETPGVCAKCGWIHPDLTCRECGHSMSGHAKAIGMLVDPTGLMSIEIFVLDIGSGPRRRRGPFDFMKD